MNQSTKAVPTFQQDPNHPPQPPATDVLAEEQLDDIVGGFSSSILRPPGYNSVSGSDIADMLRSLAIIS
jgi:hypothetical protein